MISSQTITKISAALIKAQAEMPVVKFDSTNKFLNTKYATLGAVIETARPILAKYDLAVVQFPISHEGRVGVRTTLLHESGEFFEDVVMLVPDSGKGLSGNQSAGVTISYLRRYAYVSVLGMYAEEDTDGDTYDQTAHKAQDKVTAIMARQWSLEQMEAIVGASNGTITDHMDASQILDLSVLPENVPVKTIIPWFKHYVSSTGKTPLDKAADANKAYTDAKKK